MPYKNDLSQAFGGIMTSKILNYILPLGLTFAFSACTSDKGQDDTSLPIEEQDTGDSPTDADGDGVSAQDDCDDANSDVYPGASDSVGDGVDQNCDGVDGVDADGDGDASSVTGGGDCDDSDPVVFSDAAEECNGIDNDCNGVVDFSDTKSACFSQGSRASFIANTNADPANQFSCTAPDGWKLWDAQATVDSLLASNQNYFGVPLKELYNNNGEKNCEWISLELLAEAMDPYADSIYFHGTLLDDLGDGTLQGRIDAYTEAIQEYRILAAEHPSMKGISIDDFIETAGRPWVEAEVDRLQPEHIALLTQVAHDPNGPGVPIEFFPYIPGPGVPTYLFEDAVILGMHGYASTHVDADGGTPNVEEYTFFGQEGSFLKDEASITASFNPGDIDTNAPYTIDLMIYDHLNVFEFDENGNPNAYWDTLNMNYVFELNGEEIARYDVRDADGVEKFLQILEMPATGLLANTDNSLRIWIDGMNTNQNKYKDKILQMFDWQLTDENGISTPLGLSNHTFTTFRDPARGFGGTERFIATTGEPWFMGDLVDATSFKYASKTEILANELEVHARFVRKTCAPFIASGKSCLEVVWSSNIWNDDLFAIDTVIHSQLMEQAKEYATGIVFWNMLNNLYDPTKGMMAERDVRDPNDFDVAAYMHTGAPIQPGLYKRWTFSAQTSGTYTWKWKFEQGGNVDNSAFYRRLDLNGTLVTQEELLEDEQGNALLGVEEVMVSAGDEVSIEVINLDSHGTRWNRTQYRILDEQGNIVDLQNASFESGYEPGAEALYDCITAFFMNEDYLSTCGRE